MPHNIKIDRNIRFINVGEDPPKHKLPELWIGRRQWEACIEYNFLSAGQNPIYSKPLLNLEENDIVAAYISGSGYVGIGRIIQTAVPIKNFYFNGRSMYDFKIDKKILEGTIKNFETIEGMVGLRKSLFENCNNINTEFVVKIEWIKTIAKKAAYWEKNNGLFAKPLIQCNLENQKITIKFLELKFDVKFIL